jgi:hypothetical protein
MAASSAKISNLFSGPRVLSSNDVKAQTRNKCELGRLEIRLKQIEKEIEVNEQSRRKEIQLIHESMKSVRESTGIAEQPEMLKAANLAPAVEVSKAKSTRSNSSNSYMFNYELIHKQAEENYGKLKKLFDYY